VYIVARWGRAGPAERGSQLREAPFATD
jgi:hypothetical protein